MVLPHSGLAQDSTEPVDDVTVISIEPTFNLQDGLTGTELTVIGAIAVFVFTAIRGIIRDRSVGNLIGHYQALLERDDLRNEVERRYLSTSLRIQDISQLFKTFVHVLAEANIPLVDGFLDVTDDFLDDVTDGEIEPDEPADQPQ